MSRKSAKTLVIRQTERFGTNTPVYRITLPREFVEANRKQLLNKEFKPTVNFMGNVVFKRV